ncbi:MAG: ThiF family adenylyltransferase [Campylobacterales bacterium]|nr:ThiF family adenylyltransferase [Campylobacterales bacterium]
MNFIVKDLLKRFILKSFEEYFNRQIQLWGDETQKSLQNKKIVIIGSGGLGCSLAVALGSSGIGQIDLVDFDTVGVHNIHRQIAFTTCDENRLKCEVLKQHILLRSPYVQVNSFPIGFEEFAKNNTTQYDLIIDATDNLPIRAKINQFAKEHQTPWIYGSVESFHGQVCFFDEADFSSVFNISDHKPAGIAAPIVMNVASLQANLALRYLANLSIKKDCLYYLFFDSQGDFTLQKFLLPK